MSVTEQRYKAVLAVIGDGRPVGEVAREWAISRRTMHRWLMRYEGDGLEGLNNRSHRLRIPVQSDHPFRTKAITYSGVSDHPAGRPASDGVS